MIRFLAIAIIALSPLAAGADIAMDAPVEAVDGCYQYQLVKNTDGSIAMAFETRVELLTEKEGAYYDKKIKLAMPFTEANEAGKTLYDEILKIEGVQRVVLNNHRVIVLKANYYYTWDMIAPQIHDKAKKILCGQ
jgi:hypothetical protein